MHVVVPRLSGQATGMSAWYGGTMIYSVTPVLRKYSSTPHVSIVENV